MVVGDMNDIIPAQQVSIAQDFSGVPNDDKLVDMWLYTRAGNSRHTRRSYERIAMRFLNFIKAQRFDLRGCTVVVLLEWIDTARHLAPRTQNQYISIVKSLYSFACEVGYCHHNITAVVKGSKVSNTLAERILTEEQIYKLLLTATLRAAQIIRLLYYTGARVSEACVLQWKHVHLSADGGVVLTLQGKGGKTRHVHLEPGQVDRSGLMDVGDPEDYVLGTRTGRQLHPSGAANIVKCAAVRAGLASWVVGDDGQLSREITGLKISPHWFRHAHASHALDRGAPPHLVQQTLGHASLDTTSGYAHANPKESSGKYLGI